MEKGDSPVQTVPRIVPTRERLEALTGRWRLGRETVRLQEDGDSGVLVALNDRGERLNPLQVISRGIKLKG
jgi:hypothetical protein